MDSLRTRVRVANVTAALALFIALGGLSWAALTLPKKSVGTAQLKKNAVTTKKVKNRTLRRKDFRGGVLLRGPQGPAGPANPVTGAAGGDLTGTYPDPEIAPNTVGGPEVVESTLQGVDAATLGGTPLGELAGVGDHDSAGACSDEEHDGQECARVAMQLSRPQRVFIVATGVMDPVSLNDTSGTGSGSDNTTLVDGHCALNVNGTVVSSATARTVVDSSLSTAIYIPFALTRVTGAIRAGVSTFGLTCTEIDGDIDWLNLNVSALGVGSAD